MRGRILLGAVAAAVLALPPSASAATALADVPASFWAHRQIGWVVSHAWMRPRTPTLFAPGHTASRITAARVLARIALREYGTPLAADPYAEATAAGWIAKGSGPGDTLTQYEFDRGLVRVLRLAPVAKALNHLHTADGWTPPLTRSFGVEQVVRAVGARFNAPEGSDQWESWPSAPLDRVTLAVEGYQVAAMPSWAGAAAESKTDILTALPAWTPLQRAVLGRAFAYAGAPYVWGGTSAAPQTLFGQAVAGGFDCSGFVWFILKLHTYTAGSTTWSGDSQIRWRTTYDMAANVPVANRIARSALRPGDILFWSSAPNGVQTAAATIYHTGIYLGGGWAINSHGSGDGVTVDYMGTGAGWFHDAFAFGWRVLPAGA